ncbi:hypothetical protein NPIL_230221 [Nephila pilipes]|uniref:Uncharacterized protein n=1 Tax=Nephila pilipes TaxID=299642 RepID=A0A8X6J0R4_NEPPI|nr:hypothetical protein NPIL_230221 [Nephila pilipes]
MGRHLQYVRLERTTPPESSLLSGSGYARGFFIICGFASPISLPMIRLTAYGAKKRFVCLPMTHWIEGKEIVLAMIAHPKRGT